MLARSGSAPAGAAAGRKSLPAARQRARLEVPTRRGGRRLQRPAPDGGGSGKRRAGGGLLDDRHLRVAWLLANEVRHVQAQKTIVLRRAPFCGAVEVGTGWLRDSHGRPVATAIELLALALRLLHHPRQRAAASLPASVGP